MFCLSSMPNMIAILQNANYPQAQGNLLSRNESKQILPRWLLPMSPWNTILSTCMRSIMLTFCGAHSHVHSQFQFPFMMTMPDNKLMPVWQTTCTSVVMPGMQLQWQKHHIHMSSRRIFKPCIHGMRIDHVMHDITQ